MKFYGISTLNRNFVERNFESFGDNPKEAILRTLWRHGYGGNAYFWHEGSVDVVHDVGGYFLTGNPRMRRPVRVRVTEIKRPFDLRQCMVWFRGELALQEVATSMKTVAYRHNEEYGTKWEFSPLWVQCQTVNRTDRHPIWLPPSFEDGAYRLGAEGKYMADIYPGTPHDFRDRLAEARAESARISAYWEEEQRKADEEKARLVKGENTQK